MLRELEYFKTKYREIYGEDFDITVNFGNKGNLLHNICRENMFDELRTELLSGIPKDYIGVQDNNGDTPLHIACRSSYYCGKYLLESGLINLKTLVTKNNNGETPLHIACYNNYDLVQYIFGLKCFSKKLLTQSDNNGNTPLILAIKHSPLEISKIFIGYSDLDSSIIEKGNKYNESFFDILCSRENNDILIKTVFNEKIITRDDINKNHYYLIYNKNPKFFDEFCDLFEISFEIMSELCDDQKHSDMLIKLIDSNYFDKYIGKYCVIEIIINTCKFNMDVFNKFYDHYKNHENKDKLWVGCSKNIFIDLCKNNNDLTIEGYQKFLELGLDKNHVQTINPDTCLFYLKNNDLLFNIINDMSIYFLCAKKKGRCFLHNKSIEFIEEFVKLKKIGIRPLRMLFFGNNVFESFDKVDVVKMFNILVKIDKFKNVFNKNIGNINLNIKTVNTLFDDKNYNKTQLEIFRGKIDFAFIFSNVFSPKHVNLNSINNFLDYVDPNDFKENYESHKLFHVIFDSIKVSKKLANKIYNSDLLTKNIFKMKLNNRTLIHTISRGYNSKYFDKFVHHKFCDNDVMNIFSNGRICFYNLNNKQFRDVYLAYNCMLLEHKNKNHVAILKDYHYKKTMEEIYDIRYNVLSKIKIIDNWMYKMYKKIDH